MLRCPQTSCVTCHSPSLLLRYCAKTSVDSHRGKTTSGPGSSLLFWQQNTSIAQWKRRGKQIKIMLCKLFLFLPLVTGGKLAGSLLCQIWQRRDEEWSHDRTSVASISEESLDIPLTLVQTPVSSHSGGRLPGHPHSHTLSNARLFCTCIKLSQEPLRH